jgi:prepilin-type processing-associated H-X9-DG protein
VVIAIIAILIAMLLPAIQKAREAANRARCQNNLKQLALAVHNYESGMRELPPAGVGYGWCGTGNGDTAILNMSGWVLLLPYIEQDATASKLNKKSTFSNYTAQSPAGALVGDATTNGNGAIANSTPIPTLMCPSDGGKKQCTSGPAYTPGSGLNGYRTSYDFVTYAYGEYSNCQTWRNASLTSKYMFGQDSNLKITEIKDGTSNTLMLAETTFDVLNGHGTAWAYRGWVMTGIDPGNGINDWSYNGSAGTAGIVGSWGRAGSAHANGCHFAMGDGSVKFLKETLSTTILTQAALIADLNTPLLD